MLSILVSLLVSTITFFGVTRVFDRISGVLLGLVAGGVVYYLIARRVRRRVEAASKEVEAHTKGQRFEKAIQAMEALRPLGRWQPFLRASTEGQIGMLRYAYLRDFEGARPHLAQAHPWLWQAHAMLGAGHFKKRRFDEMEKVFEKATRRNKKEGLLWATYAWCQWKRGLRDPALQIMARARQVLPSDERLKTMQIALQNGKKLKMHSYGAEWLALHLETPAGAPAVPPGGPRPPRYTPPLRVYGGGRAVVRRGVLPN